MEYKEEDFLMLSGLQHFAFCRRQWALIHIENQWAENLRTVEGQLMHAKAHDGDIRETRGDKIISRSVNVYSAQLGISEQCDVLEYHREASGIPLPGHDGLWQPYPIEYKRGEPKENDSDALQLCAQAMPSLPTRGAWIEIPRKLNFSANTAMSLPTRGAWIEMTKQVVRRLTRIVAPRTGSVD